MLIARKFILLTGSLFCLKYSSGQDFIIRHDMIKDETSYFKVLKQQDTVKIKRIVVNKQGKLVLKIEDFNPFYWRAKVTAEKNTDQYATANSGVFNPFSFLAQNIGGLLKSVVPGLNLPELSGKGSISESAGVNNKFIFQVGEYQELYTRLQNAVQQSDDLKILSWRLNELKYDFHKTGAAIKAEARAEVMTVTGTDRLQLDTVLSKGRNWNRELTNILDSLGVVKGKITQLESQVDKSIRVNDITLDDMSAAVRQTFANLDLLSASIEKIDFVNELQEIAKTYNEIQVTEFKYSCILKGEPDISELKLQLYPSASANPTDTVTKYFPVQARGSFRMRNSVGLSFTYFRDKNKRFFISPDTTIGSSRADLFTPAVSVFIHFYGIRSTGFKAGGTIGFGIPISGEKNDINYLLGFSAVIGRNEPVFISAGIAGTKVLLLDKGWENGDKVPSLDFTAPTFSAFRVGGFLSITFNLNQVLSNKK